MALAAHACSAYWAQVQRAMSMQQGWSIVVQILAACAAASQLPPAPLATSGVHYVLFFDGTSRGNPGQAEHVGLLTGLRAALRHGWAPLEVVGDGMLVAAAIAKFPGLSDICVYGVKVPGNEGRACLAAMVFDENSFDMQAFATHDCLGEMSVTGTMKYEKRKLRKQGIDPSQASDKLWYFVKAKNTYKSLTAQNFHAAVTSSRL